MKKIVAWVSLLTTLLFCPIGNAQTTTPIDIGAIFSTSGYEAPIGKQALRGAQVGVDWINQHGGVNGRPIQLTIKNSMTRADIAAAAAKELAQQSKINVLIGLTDDTRLAAAMVEVEKYHKLLITPAATSGKLAAAYSDNLILTCYTDTQQAEAAAMFTINTLRMKNVLLLSDISSRYTLNISAGFEQKFNALDGNIVAKVKYKGNHLDIPHLIKEAQSHRQEAQAIYLAANEHALEIIKALRQAGFKQPILSGDGFDSNLIIKDPSSAISNIYFTTHVVLNFNHARGMQRQFMTLYYQKYHTYPQGAFTALGFDSVLLATEALRHAKQDNTKGLRDVIYKLKDFPGASSVFNFKNSNVPTKSIYIVKIVNHQRHIAQVISDIKPLLYPSGT